MTPASARSSPPGWHPDPTGLGALRWWNGTNWTEHLAPWPNPALAYYPVAATTRSNGMAPGQSRERGPKPRQVVLAVRLMLVNAALGAVSIVFQILTKDTLRDMLRAEHPGKSAHQIDNLLNASISAGIDLGAVFLGVYVMLALRVGRAKNWARITTWVFAGIGVLSGVTTIGSTYPPMVKAFSVTGAVIDIVITVLLAQKPSNDYFRKHPSPGYPLPQPHYLQH